MPALLHKLSNISWRQSQLKAWLVLLFANCLAEVQLASSEGQVNVAAGLHPTETAMNCFLTLLLQSRDQKSLLLLPVSADYSDYYK